MIQKMNIMMMMVKLMNMTSLKSNAIETTMKTVKMLKAMMLISEQNEDRINHHFPPLAFAEQAKEVAAASEEALPGWKKKQQGK